MRGKVCLIAGPGLARDSFYLHLRQMGHQVWAFADLPSAISLIRKERVQAVVLDLDLADLTKESAIKDILAQGEDILVLALVDYPQSEEGLKALKAGAWAYLTRPVDLEELEILLERGRKTQELKRRFQFLEEARLGLKAKEKLVYKSRDMASLVQSIRRIGKGSQGPLMLSGETGTGKEFLARWMHDKTRAASHPFLSINCASLSRKRLLNELFGSGEPENGHYPKPLGKLELAGEGTVLLKSVESLNPYCQRKLARYLMGIEGLPMPRIVSTTTLALESLVGSARLLPELLYRINTFALVVPPLRERRPDIVPLAEHFLSSLARAKGRPVSKISASARRKLENYSWPGNVAELKQVIERAFLLDRDGIITTQELTPAL